MENMGLQGVVRGKKVITTDPDATQPCPEDKVIRAFVADTPNQLWVSDLTHVSSWQGMVYVAPRHGHSDQWRFHGSICRSAMPNSFHREARLDSGIAVGLLAATPACRRGIPAHLGVKPDRQRAPALERFIIGWPVPGLVSRGCRSAHAAQLPCWIHEMNPSRDLCNMCNRPKRKRDFWS